MLKKEIQVFLTAVMFYTRIPCPSWIDHSEELLNLSTKYFTSIGWIVGTITGLVCWISLEMVPIEIAVIISMIVSLLLTGGFHEDGFADMCDGFGGGWTKEKILEIMKDSRMGAYGTMGLILLFLSKWMILVKLGYVAPWAMLVAHPLSRWVSTTTIFTHQYARDDATSKAKPIAKQMNWKNYVIATFIAFLTLLLFLPSYQDFLLIILSIEILRRYWTNYFQKWLGGYTGDCLGALQQMSEVFIYLLLLSLPIVYVKFSLLFW
jgi:adenosylcobinamide-GDP ribazoletransferase